MTIKQKTYTTVLTMGASLYALPLMAAESDGGGLPQLDTTLFPEQLFWLAISFALLYLLMSRVALPGVHKTQNKRSALLTSELAAAKAANDAAQDIIIQYEKTLAAAHDTARTTVTAVITQAAKDEAAHEMANQQEFAKRLRDAEAKIIAARDESLKNIGESATELATNIVDRMIGIKSGAKA